jgi:tetratricopeptide (TPR) repeat protein
MRVWCTNFIVVGLAATTVMAPGSAHAEDAMARFKREELELREQLLKRCPGQRETITQLEGASGALRLELYLKLDSCGAKLEPFLIKLGSALNMVARYEEAEAAFRRAMKLRVTEAAQLGLLTALSRQASLTQAQKADLTSNLNYFRRHACSRDDLCASLAYVAWHVEDLDLAKRSSERAIELKFPGWQPYFTAGTVYATGSAADRVRAIELLQEAKGRGGPAKAIDGFLSDLGVNPASPRSKPDAGS